MAQLRQALAAADAVVIGAGAGLSISAGFTYDKEAVVKKMVAEQKDRKIPGELIPRCPVCGASLERTAVCRYPV